MKGIAVLDLEEWSNIDGRTFSEELERARDIAISSKKGIYKQNTHSSQAFCPRPPERGQG